MKTFKFIKKIFISALMYFVNLSNVNSLECISMENQECKVRPEIVNFNSNNPIFYPFSIKIIMLLIIIIVIILMIYVQKFAFLIP